MSFPEAAKLADHYINGKGKKLTIESQVYQTSVIVKDASAAIKDFIRDQVKRKTVRNLIQTTDPDFIHSKQGKSLTLSAGREAKRDGNLILKKPAVGYILTEQNNLRLKNCNNRFVLSSKQLSIGPSITTQWSVNDKYEFEPFSSGAIYTDIPLGSYVLKFPDGLSHYMTVLKIADAFEYSADWTETWHV